MVRLKAEHLAGGLTLLNNTDSGNASPFFRMNRISVLDILIVILNICTSKMNCSSQMFTDSVGEIPS